MLRQVRAWGWFWFSLFAALMLVAYSFRYRMPDPALCADQAEIERGTDTFEAMRLPIRRVPGLSEHRIERFRLQFRDRQASANGDSLYLGEATPFVHVRFNGVELTPAIDLTARNRRVLAPQLLALPRELWREPVNDVELRLPLDHRLSELRLSLVCLGDTARLRPVWRWNWWHQVGVPWICLSILTSMLLIGVLSFRLFERNGAMLWFAAVVVLALVRVIYLGLPIKPGSALLWRTLSDISMVMLVWVLYRLIRALWPSERRWLDRSLFALMLISTSALLLTLIWPWHLLFPNAQTAFWLMIAGSAVGLVWAMAGALGQAHPLEWRRVMWGLLFGALISAMEAATYKLPMASRFIWTYPIGITVIVIAFGTLLVRRAVLGMNVLQRAASVLAQDLDLALRRQSAAAGEQIVDDLKSQSAEHERQRMLKDIHDGFGSRLVGVLAQIRREQPDSALCRDMQRALVDLRLMIDAMDESARSLDVAFGMLRHRLQASLEPLGLQVSWQVDSLPALQVDDRRKLMQLFRCIEELISNIVQHAAASRIEIHASHGQGMLSIRVRDDGRGIPAQVTPGRGRANIARRLAALGGELREIGGLEGRGYGVELRVPRM